MGTTEPAASRVPSRVGTAVFVLAATLIPLGYAWYTGHVWEDYLITFRHSQNLCEGHGLVYRPGERVHGFTSPLGTLLPALCHLATGQTSYLAALWLFRVLSAAAFAGAGLLLLRVLSEGHSGRFALAVLGVLYVLEAKAVAFSMNGMETAFMLLFFAWGLLLVTRERFGNWFAFGLCGAGLMWTRPDGCVLLAALALAALLFAGDGRKATAWTLLKGGLVCAALYLPWFLWAWGYYGSPVPNTIRAKATYDPTQNTLESLQRMVERLPGRTAEIFRPIYSSFGGWPKSVRVLTALLSWFSALYWLLPLRDRPGRVASFCFAVLSLYLSWLSLAFPWYLPPAAACGLVVVVRGTLTLGERVRGVCPPAPVLAGTVLLLLCGAELWLFAQIARQMRVQQAEIEEGSRMRVGLWLKDHVRDGERVYLEPLGYIGYFSEAKMLDFPGLVAPEVVQARRERPRDFVAVGLHLMPEWMVLRPNEAARMADHEAFRDHYALEKEFDVSGRLEEYPTIFGKEYLAVDSAFKVYRKKPDTSAR
jgi:hypothetical protein